MKKSFLFILSFLMCFTAFAQQESSRQQRLHDHVYYLASDSLKGRKAGTENSAKAAAYLINQYEQMGLKPFFADGWKVPFQRSGYSNSNFFNVIGLIEGNDPQLKDEYIVLGAHFDHIGMKNDSLVYNGADDNASGSAALVEVTRELLKNQANLKRSVIIAAFDGEELGLFGSYALADTLQKLDLLKNVKLMMSIDMVGWYQKSGELILEGVGTIKNGKKTLNNYSGKNAITLNLKKFEKSIFTATDTQGFAQSGIATLAVTTGTKSPYHKPEDDADLIDYSGMDKICGYVTDVTMDVASNPNYAPSGRVAEKHRGSLPRFELGVMAGVGSARIAFPDASLETNGGFGFEAGLTSTLNFNKYFGLRTDVLYEEAHSHFPVEANLFASSGKVTMRSVCVPVMLLLQVREGRSANAFVGFGGFYRRVLDSKYSDKVTVAYPIRDDQFGLSFAFGFGVGPYSLGCDVRSNFKSFIDTKDVNAKLKTVNFILSRRF